MRDTLTICQPQEPEGYGVFPVQCDEDKDKCAHCENQDAEIEVTYRRKSYTFNERLCMACYLHPDYDWVKVKFMDEIVSIKSITQIKTK